MTKGSTQRTAEKARAAVAMTNEESVTASVAALSEGEDNADPSGQRLSIRERISYGVGDVGGNLLFSTAGSFLLFYLTDVVGIGAAIAGTLLLFGRILDGTLDLIIGSLIDRTSTRWGKARPWILFSTPVLVISFVLLFNVPAGLNEGGKEIYAFTFYFAALGIGFVSSNLAYHTLLSVITSSSKMRISLTVIRTFCSLFTALVVNVVTIPLLSTFGGGQGGWTVLSIGYGAVATITFLVVFFGTKERVAGTVKKKDGQSLPVRESLGILLKSPYFYLVLGYFFLSFILSGTYGVGVYFAQDVLGDANLWGVLAATMLAPVLIGMWFMPKLVGKYGKRKLLIIGAGVTVIGAVISLTDPTNLTLLIIGGLVRSAGSLPGTAASFAMVADVVDFIEWKKGERLDGMTYAAATAGQNFGGGLGTALVGWILAAASYNGAAAVQSDGVVSAEIFIYLWLPLLVTVLSGVLAAFFGLDSKLGQIQRDLAGRRQAAKVSSH